KDLPPKQQLDLHWQIADLFTFPVDAEQLIEQQKLICVQGESLAALPFVMLFVYVCVHGHTDYFFRLRYLVDVYAAMHQSEFNKVEVLEIAKNLGVEQKVIDSIATAKLFFDGEQTRNEYAVFVLKRFVDSNGFPERSHPNHKQWTRLDRRQYLLKQIEYRSANSRWYEPIVARCKYNESMIDSWPEHIPPWIWYPVALVKRLLKEPLIKSK
ncbi:MAG: nucleotidyltransferase family protein, partial [Arenicella sp.]|nr:nucleotidyltransferase family protein [Arenicella sp.]